MKTLMIIFTALPFQIFAQLGEPYQPYSRHLELSTEDLPTIGLGSYDNEALQLEDSDTCEMCNLRFGIDIFREINLAEAGTNETYILNGQTQYIKRMEFLSPTAEALHLYFKHFELSEDVRVYFYSPDYPQKILGAFTGITIKTIIVSLPIMLKEVG
ncbi:MAG: hypothetical protein M3Q97_09665 [Bacteroidota bacterium]|nr:hypothetical protein [Bacteroidota bacterium]